MTGDRPDTTTTAFLTSNNDSGTTRQSSTCSTANDAKNDDADETRQKSKTSGNSEQDDGGAVAADLCGPSLPTRRRPSRARRFLTASSSSSSSPTSPRIRFLVTEALFHLSILAVYLIPMILFEETGQDEMAVLDEIHMLSTAQGDVFNSNVSWQEIFTNDYWGRPMNSPSSHKSWRPLTVLTFRYWKNNPFFSNVFVQRLFNVITHAALAEGVGILATRLVSTHVNASDAILRRRLTKILFALHPTHVEVTANSANRPHLLAALIAVWLCTVPVGLVTMPILLLVGFLSCETFLFAIVPIAATRAILMLLQQEEWRRPHMLQSADTTSAMKSKQRIWPWIQLLGAWILLGVSGIAYYAMRYHLDWLSIPDGLIRPAENPFYDLRGWDRIRSYAYVTVVHILKAWDWDVVGFRYVL